jgi:hypothetical protein
MIKLLVNNPQGKQELIEIHESGSYYDEDSVVFDERKSGKFPEDMKEHVGYLKKYYKKLIIDESLKESVDNEQNALDDAEALKAAKKLVAAAKLEELGLSLEDLKLLLDK